MTEKPEETIHDQVKRLIASAASPVARSEDALRYSQAALNAAYADRALRDGPQ